MIPSIPKALMRHAHASCRATFRFEDGDPVIEGKVDYREKQRATTIEARGSEVMTVSRTTRKRRAKRGHAAFEETPISLDALVKLGGFDLEIYWYNRGIVDSIEGLTENKTASRAEIARWSGGPMLYRYGYRVLPFGDPDDDWISLDKRAFGSSGFKLNRQQVFGRLQIQTPHRYLSEQTNREGLVQSEVSDALTRLVMWVVHVEFRNFINEVDKQEKLQFRKEELENNQILRAEKTLVRAVSDLRGMLDGQYEQEIEEVVSTARDLREEALAVLARLDEVEKQSTEDREQFVYLAGVGLMTEFIFHELERAVSHTMRVISEVGATPTSVSTLKDQLQTLHKRVAAFDELTGEKRQTKTRFDLREVVREVLDNHEREFARHSIDLVLNIPEVEFTIRAVRGMVIQILENLVVNAAYWLKRQAEYEEGFGPQLVVTVDDEARRMMVQDNGPGVPGVAQGADIPTVRYDQAFRHGQGFRVVHRARHGRVPRLVTRHRVARRTCPVGSHKRFRTADGVTVNYATQIIDSFKASVVERILVVDDAYDPPVLSEEHLGGLLEVLQGLELREYVTDESLGDEDLHSAIDALSEGEFDDESISDAVSSLFDAYIHLRTAAIDPGGQFSRLKDSSLEGLDPLLELLKRCGDELCIRRVGKDAALSVCRELRPDLVLMDFFLSPPDRTTGASTRKEELADRKSSIDLLKSILQVDGGMPPAVILMSSEDVQERAQRYRSSLEGRVTALRFGFLNKKWIRHSDDGPIALGDAADVLMDTSGSFEFGRTLEAALRQWKLGAETGLKELYSELRDLDVKDFAYLLRFRLYEEGEPFADYLEWFLGESLRAVVDNEVAWNAEEFARLNEQELTEAIEGAHPVPSSRIAQIFHRMRFNSRQNRIRVRFGLGDLFIAPDKKSVRMVINPDCDLVLRGGRRGASRLLTVGGTIRGLGDEKAIAGDLILYGTPKAPHLEPEGRSVAWLRQYVGFAS